MLLVKNMKGLRRVNYCRHFFLSVRQFCVAEFAKQERLSNESRRKSTPKIENNTVPVILCKNEKFNHYAGQKYGKFDVVPLASNGWYHRKSKGDYFRIMKVKDTPLLDCVVQKSFQSMKIPHDVSQCLESRGISHPTPIQADSIPLLLKGHNVMMAAETGSGKTFAYLLPLVTLVSEYRNQITREKLCSPFVLIVTPSRDLAHQIGDNAKLFSDLGVSVQVLTGGHTKRLILSPSFKEVDILVASLGALSKLIATGIYRINHVRHIVLDEADTLLDDSFNPKLLALLRRFSFIPQNLQEISSERPNCQMCLASATIPTSINELLADAIPLETLQRVTSGNLHYIQPHVPQLFMRLGRMQKVANLLSVAKSSAHKKEPVVIFSNKSSTCDWISLFLNENGIKCTNLNSSMRYNLRMGKFKEFQTGLVDFISCTDMGSRGLDTVRAKHILNYDFPIYMADYVHRCGRTGRIGSPSDCHITHFISGQLEVELVKKIELAVRKAEPLPNVNANINRIIRHKYSEPNVL